MRSILAIFALLSASSLALAQPVKPAAKTPEQLLPADCIAYFRYDGYDAHRKAYDQTALAKVMKEGLGDFLDHGFSQLLMLGGDAAARGNPKKGDGHRQAADRFLEYIWNHGFAVAVEFAPVRNEARVLEDQFQVTIVFPQGAAKKNRAAIENVLRLAVGAFAAEVKEAKHGGRPGHTGTLGNLQAHWWPEGEHLILTFGEQSATKALRVIDGPRPNLTSAKWHTELIAFKSYETDMRGYVNLQKIVDRIAILGLEEGGLANIKERIARQVILTHLGLTGLKDATFHLGFDGKYQRSTIRIGVPEPDRRAGLLRLVTGPIAWDPAKLPPLPPDADYVSARHIDWENVYDYLRTTYGMAALSKLFQGELPERFPDLDRALGVDFRKDFLQQLDPTLVSWGAHSEGPFFIGQGFAVKVKDAAKVKKSLQAIGKTLGDMDPKMVPVKKMYRGHEMQIFNNSPIPITYTVHDDWLVVGLFPQPVQGYLLRSGGKYRTWKMPPEATVAFGKDTSKSKLLFASVSDPRPSIEIGLSLMPVLVQTINASTRMKLVEVGEIPNAQSINEWLFPNSTMAYDDGNALRLEHHYSMNEPEDFLLVQLFPYWVNLLGFLPLRLDAPAARMAQAVPAEADPDPKRPVLLPATADEKDGVVRIYVTETRKVPYFETVQVEKKVVERVVEKGVAKEVTRSVFENVSVAKEKDVSETRTLMADGKTIQVSRKDGKAVDPKMLPMLLKQETPVVLVNGSEPDAAFLEKVDERTLIIRVTPDKAPKDDVPEPRKMDDPKKPISCAATAMEKDGVISIQVKVIRRVPYTVNRMVPERVAFEVVVDGEKKTVFKTVVRPVSETTYKDISEFQVLIADGKKVQVTRKDRKPVDFKSLPTLLKKETQVVLVRGDAVLDAAYLEKLDEKTLIIRVAP